LSNIKVSVVNLYNLFQIMKPEARTKKVPVPFSYQEDHVLQIDRKRKSLQKKKQEEDRQKDKLRKENERQKKKEKKVQELKIMKKGEKSSLEKLLPNEKPQKTQKKVPAKKAK
jgi:hypothetical protein